MGTLTQVGNNIFRINHPQVNASLTRMGGIPPPKMIGRCFRAIGMQDVPSIGFDIDFRRGKNTRKWYFAVTPNNNLKTGA